MNVRKSLCLTIDERIAFLLESTESLHVTAAELTAQMQEHTRQLQEHTKQLQEQTKQLQEQTIHLQEHTRQLQIDAENIRRLANIAASHEARLEHLEGDDGE
jgi:DNA anti-recombination protein RmuC